MNQFKVRINGKDWYILWVESGEWHARKASTTEVTSVDRQLAQNQLKPDHTAAITACDGAHLVDEAREVINS